MTEIRASTAAAGRPLMSTASHLVARAARCFRLEWRRREEGSAVCLLVVRSGLATARPAVTLALVGATLLASSASLIGMTYLNRDPILSVRKTLALTAARPLPQDEPGESNLKRASSVPAWVVEHFSPNVQNPGWAVITVAETGLGSPAFPLQAQSPSPTPAPEHPLTGVWAANDKACSPQLNREGYLPTIINDQGAWAGETTCAFKSLKGEGNTFVAAAVCSDPHKSWRARVRLTIDGRRLTWASRSGSRVYTRCDQGQARTHVAQAAVH
jgi:hypothetical protein